MAKYKKILPSFIWLLAICVMACSCQTPTSPEAGIVWQQSISTSELVGGTFPVLVYQGGVLSLGSKNHKTVLLMFDKVNGSKRWEWSDMNPSDGGFFVTEVYIFNDILVVLNGSNRYAINLKDGTTVWKNNVNNSSGGSRVTGLGDSYFIPSYNTKIFRGSVFTGRESEIISLVDTSSKKLETRAMAPAPYTATSGDTILLIGYNRSTNNIPSNHQVWLRRFNLTQQKTEFDTLLREGALTPVSGLVGILGLPVIYRNKVFIDIGKSIQCNDVDTGNLLWRRDFQGNFLAANSLIVENKLVANSEDDETLFALDVQTGTTLWQTKTSSPSANLFAMNGVVYVVGNGDGKLYAVSVSDGKKLWEFKSADNASSNGASFFTENVTGDGQYIYVRTFLNLYCYKAAR